MYKEVIATFVYIKENLLTMKMHKNKGIWRKNVTDISATIKDGTF